MPLLTKISYFMRDSVPKFCDSFILHQIMRIQNREIQSFFYHSFILFTSVRKKKAKF